MNLVPGVVMLSALIYALPRSKPQLSLLRQADWLGIALMAVGLAAFQTVLDDGNVYDWFGSSFIVQLSIISAIALSAFVIVELMREHPLIHLRLLAAAQFRLRHARQLPARLRAVRLSLSAAAVSCGLARLRRAAERRGHGLDRRCRSCS